jgi:N-acetylglucosaminyldiphosphoundecaprenol N-acetyl-beta-D-mannosaminyltransferase
MSTWSESLAVKANELEIGCAQANERCVQILGIPVSTLRRDELLDLMELCIQTRSRLRVMHVNAHAINLAYHLPALRQAFNRADVVFCDGFGVKWAARLLGKRIPERYTPPDWISLLCERCVLEQGSIFLLGARPQTIEKAAAVLAQQHPGLRIAGFQHGYFDRTPGSAENESVLAAIERAHPDVLIVGFGMPTQELWVAENSARLQAQVILTAGAIFDYISGELRRPPRWMTDHGLEWFGRLLLEPQRLWKRYILGNPLFLWRVMQQRLGWLHVRN